MPRRAGEPVQSALTVAGPGVQDIVTLTSVLTIGTVLILLGVIALLVYAVVRGPGPVSTDSGSWGGVVFPTVVLSALLFHSTRMTDALAVVVPPGVTRIEVEGRQWWWEVR